MVLTDGHICLSEFGEHEAPKAGTVCVVNVDGFEEFAEFLRVKTLPETCGKCAEAKFLRVAESGELQRLASNNEAIGRVHTQFRKWLETNNVTIHMFSARFSVYRKRLTLRICALGNPDFGAGIKLLENRFQTKADVYLVNDREFSAFIGGFGTCGRTLCCSHGRKQAVDIKSVKSLAVSMQDANVNGVCGKLKCCLKFEQE